MEIYKKLLSVQTKLKAPKSQYNSFGKYSYRNCEDILEALKPLLAETDCTLLIRDTVEVCGESTYITAHVSFIDCDTGDSVEVQASAREEQTKKGMDASQITGSTSSYARKYALNGLFCIDDTKDADTDEQKTESGARSAQTTANKATTKVQASAQKSEEERISDVDVSVFREYLVEHKLSEEKILSAYKKKDAKELTVKNLTGIMKPENLEYWKQKCSL